MKYEIISKMKHNGIVAVVRGKSKQEAVAISSAIIEGGIKNIEATFTTPDNLEVIRELSQKFADNNDVVIGAGTVLDAITARLAILAGAKFIVSPAFDKETAKICNLYGITYYPGCATQTEITTAMQYGCEIIKVFPGGLLKPSFIKDTHGPIPHVELMPSGGVNIDNVGEWVKSGAFAVSIGSALSAGYETKGKSVILENTKAFVKAYRDALNK